MDERANTGQKVNARSSGGKKAGQKRDGSPWGNRGKKRRSAICKTDQTRMSNGGSNVDVNHGIFWSEEQGPMKSPDSHLLEEGEWKSLQHSKNCWQPLKSHWEGFHWCIFDLYKYVAGLVTACQSSTLRAGFQHSKTNHVILSPNYLLRDDPSDQKGGSLPLPGAAPAFPQPPERSGSKTGNSRQIRGGVNTLLQFHSTSNRRGESVCKHTMHCSISCLCVQHNIYIHLPLALLKCCISSSHILLSICAFCEMYHHWILLQYHRILLYRRTVHSTPCPWY